MGNTDSQPPQRPDALPTSVPPEADEDAEQASPGFFRGILSSLRSGVGAIIRSASTVSAASMRYVLSQALKRIVYPRFLKKWILDDSFRLVVAENAKTGESAGKTEPSFDFDDAASGRGRDDDDRVRFGIENVRLSDQGINALLLSCIRLPPVESVPFSEDGNHEDEHEDDDLVTTLELVRGSSFGSIGVEVPSWATVGRALLTGGRKKEEDTGPATAIGEKGEGKTKKNPFRTVVYIDGAKFAFRVIRKRGGGRCGENDLSASEEEKEKTDEVRVVEKPPSPSPPPSGKTEDTRVPEPSLLKYLKKKKEDSEDGDEQERVMEEQSFVERFGDFLISNLEFRLSDLTVDIDFGEGLVKEEEEPSIEVEEEEGEVTGCPSRSQSQATTTSSRCLVLRFRIPLVNFRDDSPLERNAAILAASGKQKRDEVSYRYLLSFPKAMRMLLLLLRHEKEGDESELNPAFIANFWLRKLTVQNFPFKDDRPWHINIDIGNLHLATSQLGLSGPIQRLLKLMRGLFQPAEKEKVSIVVAGQDFPDDEDFDEDSVLPSGVDSDSDSDDDDFLTPSPTSPDRFYSVFKSVRVSEFSPDGTPRLSFQIAVRFETIEIDVVYDAHAGRRRGWKASDVDVELLEDHAHWHLRPVEIICDLSDAMSLKLRIGDVDLSERFKASESEGSDLEFSTRPVLSVRPVEESHDSLQLNLSLLSQGSVRMTSRLIFASARVLECDVHVGFATLRFDSAAIRHFLSLAAAFLTPTPREATAATTEQKTVGELGTEIMQGIVMVNLEESEVASRASPRPWSMKLTAKFDGVAAVATTPQRGGHSVTFQVKNMTALYRTSKGNPMTLSVVLQRIELFFRTSASEEQQKQQSRGLLLSVGKTSVRVASRSEARLAEKRARYRAQMGTVGSSGRGGSDWSSEALQDEKERDSWQTRSFGDSLMSVTVDVGDVAIRLEEDRLRSAFEFAVAYYHHAVNAKPGEAKMKAEASAFHPVMKMRKYDPSSPALIRFLQRWHDPTRTSVSAVAVRIRLPGEIRIDGVLSTPGEVIGKHRLSATCKGINALLLLQVPPPDSIVKLSVDIADVSMLHNGIPLVRLSRRLVNPHRPNRNAVVVEMLMRNSSPKVNAGSVVVKVAVSGLHLTPLISSFAWVFRAIDLVPDLGPILTTDAVTKIMVDLFDVVADTTPMTGVYPSQPRLLIAIPKISVTVAMRQRAPLNRFGVSMSGLSMLLHPGLSGELTAAYLRGDRERFNGYLRFLASHGFTEFLLVPSFAATIRMLKLHDVFVSGVKPTRERPAVEVVVGSGETPLSRMRADKQWPAMVRLRVHSSTISVLLDVVEVLQGRIEQILPSPKTQGSEEEKEETELTPDVEVVDVLEAIPSDDVFPIPQLRISLKLGARVFILGGRPFETSEHSDDGDVLSKMDSVVLSIDGLRVLFEKATPEDSHLFVLETSLEDICILDRVAASSRRFVLARSTKSDAVLFRSNPVCDRQGTAIIDCRARPTEKFLKVFWAAKNVRGKTADPPALWNTFRLQLAPIALNIHQRTVEFLLWFASPLLQKMKDDASASSSSDGGEEGESDSDDDLEDIESFLLRAETPQDVQEEESVGEEAVAPADLRVDDDDDVMQSIDDWDDEDDGFLSPEVQRMSSPRKEQPGPPPSAEAEPPQEEDDDDDDDEKSESFLIESAKVGRIALRVDFEGAGDVRHTSPLFRLLVALKGTTRRFANVFLNLMGLENFSLSISPFSFGEKDTAKTVADLQAAGMAHLKKQANLKKILGVVIQLLPLLRGVRKVSRGSVDVLMVPMDGKTYRTDERQCLGSSPRASRRRKSDVSEFLSSLVGGAFGYAARMAGVASTWLGAATAGLSSTTHSRKSDRKRRERRARKRRKGMEFIEATSSSSRGVRSVADGARQAAATLRRGFREAYYAVVAVPKGGGRSGIVGAALRAAPVVVVGPLGGLAGAFSKLLAGAKASITSKKTKERQDEKFK